MTRPAAAEPVELAGSTLEVARAAGAESCPDAEALKLRTSTLGKPRVHSGTPPHVLVEFSRTPLGFTAIVRTTGRSQGERELFAAGASCEPLAHATAVVLAVLLDLLPPDEPVARARMQAAPPIPPAPVAGNHIEYVSLGADLGVQYGLFGAAPSTSIGGGARLRFGHAEFGLGGFFSPGRSVDLGTGVASASLAGGMLDACGYLSAHAAALDYGACTLFSLARFAAKGRGYYADDETASLWIAGGIGIRLLLSLGRHWAFRSGLDVIVPFHQYTVEVQRVGTAYAASPVAGSLHIGLEWRFR